MIRQIQLGNIAVDVVFKDIKNVHLSVYPPTGRVRISAPSRMRLDTVRVFAISKLGWIKQQQKKLREQERETPREYLDRESHYVWGKRYLLKGGQARRGSGSGAETQQDAAVCPPRLGREKETGRAGRMVSGATQRGGSAFDHKMGAADGRECGAVLCTTNENEVGQL